MYNQQNKVSQTKQAISNKTTYSRQNKVFRTKQGISNKTRYLKQNKLSQTKQAISNKTTYSRQNKKPGEQKQSFNLNKLNMVYQKPSYTNLQWCVVHDLTLNKNRTLEKPKRKIKHSLSLTLLKQWPHKTET